ncbi:MAG TPA: 23S rRNA (guanosine(2251)-2'-O)-methyltransferase RlmB [Vicinamibacterales bacterium]|nr:23S rRNA (guanosine(2251)-2'-O)-methyltransferase RlmB [Vicinamibacterales bacterium]
MRIYGINPVLEALRAGRVTSIQLSPRADSRVQEIVTLAESRGVTIARRPAEAIDRLVGGARRHSHQGVVAEVSDRESFGVAELVQGAAAAPLLVVLDQIEDPHNVGAILRTVDAAGADGVIQQSRRAARLDGAAAKTSAGALAHVRVAEVVNIARALEELKEAGVWTVGLAGEAEKRYDEVDLTLPTALVIGAEGSGLRRLVRERCDWLISIPLRGHVQSLNASVAAGIALFEAVRQRRAAHPKK